MNVQYAIAGGRLFVLEVNPRASRTVPYVAKATGVPLARLATRLMLGTTLRELGLTPISRGPLLHQGAGVPVHQVPGVDPKLSPEMKSPAK